MRSFWKYLNHEHEKVNEPAFKVFLKERKRERVLWRLEREILRWQGGDGEQRWSLSLKWTTVQRCMMPSPSLCHLSMSFLTPFCYLSICCASVLWFSLHLISFYRCHHTAVQGFRSCKRRLLNHCDVVFLPNSPLESKLKLQNTPPGPSSRHPHPFSCSMGFSPHAGSELNCYSGSPFIWAQQQSVATGLESGPAYTSWDTDHKMT